MTATQDLRPREVLLRVRLGLPVAQLLVVAAVIAAVASWSDRAWGPGDTAGWGFWALALAGMLALGLSAWTGWALLRLTWRSTLRWPNVVAVLGEATTCLVLGPALVVMPLVFLSELLYVPI